MSSLWDDVQRADLIRGLRAIEDAGRSAAVALSELRVVTDQITEKFRDDAKDVD